MDDWVTVMFDPPEGWKYGYPKPVLYSIVTDEKKLQEYLINDPKYPDKLIDVALKHSRYWKW